MERRPEKKGSSKNGKQTGNGEVLKKSEGKLKNEMKKKIKAKGIQHYSMTYNFKYFWIKFELVKRGHVFDLIQY